MAPRTPSTRTAKPRTPRPVKRNTLKPDQRDPASLVSKPPVDTPLAELPKDPLVEHVAGQPLPDEPHRPTAGRAVAAEFRDREVAQHTSFAARLATGPTSSSEPLDLPPIESSTAYGESEVSGPVEALEESILLKSAEEEGLIPPENTAPHFRTTVEGFKDVSAELERTYHYPDGGKETFKEPLRLHVSVSGGHRLYLADDTCVYIKNDWRFISWKVREGANHFDF